MGGFWGLRQWHSARADGWHCRSESCNPSHQPLILTAPHLLYQFALKVLFCLPQQEDKRSCQARYEALVVFCHWFPSTSSPAQGSIPRAALFAWPHERGGAAGLSKLAGVDASEEAVNEAVAQMVPIGKVGAKWDIAITVVFLCSSAARHLTGVLSCLALVGHLKRPRTSSQRKARTGLQGGAPLCSKPSGSSLWYRSLHAVE